MRTPLFAAALSLSLVGCLVGDAGTPATGGDDDGTGTGTNPGTGSDPGTGSNPPAPTPTVTAAVDKATVTTELGKTELVTLTLTSGGSFAGDVTVTPSLVDAAAGTPLANGITVTGQPTVALTANATATAMFTIKIPTNATGADLAATLKLDVSSSAGTEALTTTLDVAAVYNVTYAAGLAGNIATHPMRAQTIAVKKGAKISLHNADAAIHITHGDGAFPHETQGATGGLSGATYTIDTAKLNGTSGNIGCHSHGSATYAKVTIQ